MEEYNLMSNDLRIDVDEDKKVCNIYNAKVMDVRIHYNERVPFDEEEKPPFYVLGFTVLVPSDNTHIFWLLGYVETLPSGPDKEYKFYIDPNTGAEYYAIDCRTHATDKQGRPRCITLYNKNKNVIVPAEYPKIGDMSVCNARLVIGELERDGRRGVWFYASSLQLLHLEPHSSIDGY